MADGQNHAPEPAHDLFRIRRGPLDVFVRPKSVAIVGATDAPGSVGRTVVANLLGSAVGPHVFPVNPKRATVLGRRCYARLADVPEPVDLGVIAVPAAVVPGVIDECLQAGVQGAIVISAGFKERGPEGAALEARIRDQLAGSTMRLIGPNCLGVISPVNSLNSSFAGSLVRAGNVGFISQSGAMLTSILDWSLDENVGFSHVFSIGSMLDVGWGDLIDFLGDDPHTTSIMIYMESVGNAKAFLSAAREVALQKPIIVIKAGRTERAAKAAASHTGALAGSEEVLEAAFRRVGVVQVRRVGELFDLAEVLAKQPRPRGPRLAILTNAGGPAVLATDALIEAGGELATLSPQTIEALDQLLPAHWSRANPVDVLGDASPELYAKCVDVVANTSECDGLLAIFAPQGVSDPVETAQRLAACRLPAGVPIMASWMGGSQTAVGSHNLSRAGIPTLSYPDSAAIAFQHMWQYSYALRALYETPSLSDVGEGRDVQGVVADLLRKTLMSGRTLLTEPESKQLLAAYDIPTVQTLTATSPAEAVACARQIGYPVVLKLLSEKITHKTDVGGVRLNVQSDQDVVSEFESIALAVERAAGPGNFDGVSVQPMIRQDGYELIVGCKADLQFGPVILFGAGGQLVEVFQDRALGLPPLTSTLARRMMERTKIYRALQGVRGRAPVDIKALERLLVRFGQLLIEQPRISEIDINPLLAGSQGLVALDARVTLHPAACDDADLPRAVIRSYPRQYVSHWTAKDGRRLLIRPIRPEDEPLMVQFHETLSEQSVYARYAQSLPLRQRTAHERLARLCFIDYDRQIALVAVDEQPAAARLVGVARLIKLYGRSEAEFAIVVSDAYQHIGLGEQLMTRLVAVGRDEKLRRIIGYIAATNRALHTICTRLGFQVAASDGPTLTMALDL